MQPQPLRNPLHASRHWRRDAVCVGVIALLAATLIPTMGIGWSDLWPSGIDDDRGAHLRGVFHDIVGQLASFYLLPALGFCLALRRRAIDLSVWAAAGLGGVVAAVIINSGRGAAMAMAGAVGAGVMVGAVNAAAVAATRRVPTWLITLATAAIAVWVAGAMADGRTVDLERESFVYWPITRMLLVAGVYSLTMMALILWQWSARGPQRPRHLRRPGGNVRRSAAALALVVSGALAAAGGAIWLVEHGSAPVPTRLIGDLRIPAAAVLAGAVMLSGPGRTLLAGLLLPASLLLVTLWRQEVPLWPWLEGRGYSFQLVELTAMVLTVQGAFHGALTAAGAARRRFMTICGIKAVVALGIVALQTTRSSYQTAHTLHFVGIVIWLHVLGVLSLPHLHRLALLVKSRLRPSGQE